MAQQISSILQSKGFINIEILGQGAISQIFKANRNNQVYAIKVLTDQTMSGQKNNYEMNEKQIYIKLNKNLVDNPCPYIVQVYEVIEEQKYTFFVQEYCDQGDLYTFLQRCHKHLNNFIFAVMMKQIIEGILYLHKHSIIHRDLKPENILVAKKDNAYILKIADFGISSQDELTKSQVGTVNYMAPEIIKSQQYGKEVDIWSYACISYEIITNQQLFQAESQFEVAKQIYTFQQFENKHFICQDLFEIIDRCLKTDPKKRITSEEILDQLEKIINMNRNIVPQELSDQSDEESISGNNSEEDRLSSKIEIAKPKSKNQTNQSNKSQQIYQPPTIICDNDDLKNELSIQSQVKPRKQQSEENILDIFKQYKYKVSDQLLKKETLNYILYQNQLEQEDKKVLIHFIFLLYTLIDSSLIKFKEFSDTLNLTQGSEELYLLDLLQFCLINCIIVENQTKQRFEYLIKNLLRKQELQQAVLTICKKKSDQIQLLFGQPYAENYNDYVVSLKRNIPKSKLDQSCNYFKNLIFNPKFYIGVTISIFLTIGGCYYYYHYIRSPGKDTQDQRILHQSNWSLVNLQQITYNIKQILKII
ncbi:hypothetical protein ABPG74_018012 [Tetrahymena malaccensis]